MLSGSFCYSNYLLIVDRGGRRSDEDRPRRTGDRDSDAPRKATSNAWAKGKPSSLGGPHKPIILKRKVVDEEPPVSVSFLFHTSGLSVYNIII